MSIGFAPTVHAPNISKQMVNSIFKQQCLKMSIYSISSAQLSIALNLVFGAILEQACMDRKYVSPLGFRHFFHNF
jgi:hypothetical protein